jgi:biotin carboxyl carrier protein
MPRYMVKVAGTEFDIELEYRSEKYYAVINGRQVEISSFQIGESRSIILIGGQSLEVDVRANGYDAHKTVFIRGQEISVDIEGYHLAQLRKTAGMAAGSAIEKTVRAPMPGLILDVKVAAGEKIAKNRPLVIIEAMKMENVIKAPADGVVKEVRVESGTSVEKDDILVEFE